MKDLRADVIIAGAGTTGTYVAWRMAAAGYRCLVFEKERLDHLGTSIGPFHMEEVAFQRHGIPLPRGDELLHTARTITLHPRVGAGVTARLTTLVVDKPRFLQRLHTYAGRAGAELIEEAEITELLLEKGSLIGVRARHATGDRVARGRLLVDASGIDGVLRTRMPTSPGFENDPILARDTLLVAMETWRGIAGELGPDIHSYLHAQGWYAPASSDTTIVGVGMPASAEGARRRLRAFAAELPFEGEVVSATGGRVPYRRPPYSLVDHGLLVIGDAAFMNRPFSGEGVSSALTACGIAVEVAAAALDRDDLSRETLWPYNTRYFREQGARFAFLMAVLPALVSLADDELDFIFSVPGLMSEAGIQALNLEHELRGTSMRRAWLPLLRGIGDGELHLGSLAHIAGMGIVASRLKSLYRRYPEDAAGLEPWRCKVAPLWRAADRARHDTLATLVARWG
jgi:flavin-dependent dehydrogenase